MGNKDKKKSGYSSEWSLNVLFSLDFAQLVKYVFSILRLNALFVLCLQLEECRDLKRRKGLYHRTHREMVCRVITAALQSRYFLSGNVWMSQCEHHYLVCRLVLHSFFLQCFYFFILLLLHSVFSPSLSCTHVRLGSVGVWRMTHLLHTSCCLTIFGLPGNPFFFPLCLCSGEKDQAMQRQHDELFSTFFYTIFQSKDL